MPDASAALICAIPLAISATHWRDASASAIGLAAGYLIAHFFIVLLTHDDPPSMVYWIEEQAGYAPAAAAFFAGLVFAFWLIARAARWLWALGFGLLVLAAVSGATLLAVGDAVAFGGEVAPELRIADCDFPPFGEGAAGYTMLGVLVIVEILVATGVGGALSRVLAPSRK